MINSGIYLIRHRASGKAYVGRSVDIKGRWQLHKNHTETARDRSPLHRAFRKYGYDAFDWIVLVGAPARLHVALERQFMLDMGTMVPAGYNVGGAAGGHPPAELLALMGVEEREQKKSEMRAASLKMRASVAERRKDPGYDAWYRTRISAAAKTRWANRKAKIASDAEYAKEADARWKARAAKAHDTAKKRAEADPEYAAARRERMVAAARKARANDPRTLAAKARKAAR